MYEKFERLSETKRTAILNASIKEFARHNYKNASTDRIVQEAGISKGSLFKYFGTKRNLFLYVYDFTVKVITDEIFSEANLAATDLLTRMKDLTNAKLALMAQYPDLFDFVVAAAFSDALEKDLKAEINQRMQKLSQEQYVKVFNGVDAGLFVEDIPPENILNIIRWTLDGIATKYKERCKTDHWSQIDLEEALEDVDSYFTLFRRFFYRN